MQSESTEVSESKANGREVSFEFPCQLLLYQECDCHLEN